MEKSKENEKNHNPDMTTKAFNKNKIKNEITESYFQHSWKIWKSKEFNFNFKSNLKYITREIAYNLIFFLKKVIF